MIETILYIEVNLLAAFVLLVLANNIRLFSSNSTNDHMFSVLILDVSVTLFIDCGTRLVDKQPLLVMRPLNNLLEVAYYIASVYLGYVWFRYAYSRSQDGQEKIKRLPLWFFLPAGVVILMAVASPVTGWLFTVTEHNEYLRGSLFWVQALVSWLYLVSGSIVLLHKAGHETMRNNRRNYYMLASFSFYPLVGSVFQTMYYGLTLVWPLAACALFLIYMDQQQRHTALDALTGLNNRRRLDTFFENHISGDTHGEAMFLIMLDLDRFKRINDELGHAAGDLALVRTSQILKRGISHGRSSDFLARYGGDEFSILCCRHSIDQVEQLMEHIRTELAADNAAHPDLPQLSFSMGYARLHRAYSSLDKAVVEADKMLYAEKERHHQEEDAALAGKK